MESFDDYTDWYANVINSCWDKLNKNGWMYAHNNFMGNALVMSKIDRKIRDSFYTNISWKRSGPKNNIKNGWGNIVDSILVFRKGSPYFEVEYTSLDPVYANSFKNKDDVGYYALAKVTGEKSRPCARFEYKGYNPVYGFRITTGEAEEHGRSRVCCTTVQIISTKKSILMSLRVYQCRICGMMYTLTEVRRISVSIPHKNP